MVRIVELHEWCGGPDRTVDVPLLVVCGVWCVVDYCGISDVPIGRAEYNTIRRIFIRHLTTFFSDVGKKLVVRLRS